ncbi:MAG: hypothetical protein RIS70_4232 [Planctomycetota bacterium]
MLQQAIAREIGWFYPWLRRLASLMMAKEQHSPSMQPTALANEVLAKLMNWSGSLSGETEKSLRILASTIAKQTLIDRGRRRTHRELYLERMRHEQSNENPIGEATASRVRIVFEAIEELESVDLQLASLVRMRFFEGRSLAEATQLLGISPRTAARRWAFAKAFLLDSIQRSEAD